MLPAKRKNIKVDEESDTDSVSMVITAISSSRQNTPPVIVKSPPM